jgi:hypothetical protein
MRHPIFVCLALVLLVLLSACSPSLSPETANPEIANPEIANSETASSSPTVGSTTTPSKPIADNLNQSPSGDSASELPEAVVQRLKLFLAAETGIEAEAIALQQSEPTEWNNACLEIPDSEEFCAEVITPGYRVVLDTPSGEYVVHTDQSGQTVRLAQTP